jgi:Uma2 family endonuclease
LIEGELVKEPSPTWKHQGIVVALTNRLLACVGERRLLVAPADLVLDRWNVMQPDLLVFASDVGAAQVPGEFPILVVEVLSPGTEARDRGVKCKRYLQAGIAEVWLVDPRAGRIEVRTRAGSRQYGADEEAASDVLPGFRVTLRALTG